jgi:hypothetical protein
MRIARQPDAPMRRRYRSVLVGLVMAALLALAIFALSAQLTRSSDGGTSPGNNTFTAGIHSAQLDDRYPQRSCG